MITCYLITLKVHAHLSLAHTARFLSLKVKIFVVGVKSLLYAGNKRQRFLSLTTIFNIKHARNSFSSLTTETRSLLPANAGNKRVVCARLYNLLSTVC